MFYTTRPLSKRYTLSYYIPHVWYLTLFYKFYNFFDILDLDSFIMPTQYSGYHE